MRITQYAGFPAVVLVTFVNASADNVHSPPGVAAGTHSGDAAANTALSATTANVMADNARIVILRWRFKRATKEVWQQ